MTHHRSYENICWVFIECVQWADVDAWNWKTEFEDEDSTEQTKNPDWLQSCLVSSSPRSEILVLSYQDRYVVLQCKYLQHDSLPKFLNNVFHITLFTAKWEKSNHEEVQKYQLVYPTVSSAEGLGSEIKN